MIKWSHCVTNFHNFQYKKLSYFVITDHHTLRIILATIVIKKLSHFETNLLSIVGRRVGPKVTITLVSKDNHKIIIIVTPIIMIIILMMIMITIEIVKVTVEVRVMLTRTIILIIIMYMKKKLRVSDWLKTSAFFM